MGSNTSLSVEAVKVVLTIFVVAYNSCVINSKIRKVAFYIPLPFQKALTDAQCKKNQDFTENEESMKTDTYYIVEICQRVVRLSNAILSVRGICIRRGFLAKIS